jgi:hypothetical protein
MSRYAAAVLFLAATAAAQNAVQNPAPTVPTGPMPTPHHVETTVSLGATAQFTATRVRFNQDGTANSQALDPAAGVLGTFRQSFAPWLGYTVNFGYARSTEVNTGELPYNASPYFGIPVDVYETSVAYHLQRHVTPRLAGWFDLGGGALTFLPVHRGPNANLFVPRQNPELVPNVIFRQMGLAAFGFDYRLTPHLAMRAEYRGLLYKYPDFDGRVGRALTFSSEPTVSIVYGNSRKK